MKHHHVHGGRARALLITLLALGLAATALLWGWNTFAVELLAQPAMHLRHALALELTVLSVAGTASLAGRLVAARRHDRRARP